MSSSAKRHEGEASTTDGAAAATTPERKKMGIWSPLLFRNSPSRGGGRQRNTTTANSPKKHPPAPPSSTSTRLPVAPTVLAPKAAAEWAEHATAASPRSASSLAAGLDQPSTASPQYAKNTSSTLPKPHFLCRNKYFRNLCQAAFDAIDLDQSGTIDAKELYSGLLLIHLKLGCYAGPAACRPLSRERCLAFFHKMDADRSGSLDKDEFHCVMGVLFGNVLLRVLAQWSLTLMIVPLLAQTVLNGMYAAVRTMATFVANLDEHSAMADSIELTVEGTWQCLVETTPDAIVAVVEHLHRYLSFVPDSVWNSIPLTLLSTLLGLVVVPWTLFQIDDFFQFLAERRRRRGGDRRK